MENLSLKTNIFSDIPHFDGGKAFSVVYLDGEFHLFFACSKAFNSVVMHYSSYDCFNWTERENSLIYSGYIDSVAVFTQNGKIYLYYAVRNLFGRTDLRLAVSKNGDAFEPFPKAICFNTELKDIKTFYSNGCRWIIGSEKKGIVPAYFSENNLTFHKSFLTNKEWDAEVADYIGSPSPFVAYDKTYIGYSMFGARVAETRIDLEKGELVLVKEVLQTYGESMRSLMLREATPLLFIGCGSSLIPVEVFKKDDDLGFRFYRDGLKSAKLRVDNGVEEDAKMPTKLVREEGILHLFELPSTSGVSLEFGLTAIDIDELKSIVIDGAIENYGIVESGLGEDDTLEVAVFDMGNLIIVEVMDKLYSVPSGMSPFINVNVGEKEYQYMSYKL